ncbi:MULTISPECIES: hypothetical protein [Mycolicibacterium]|uniref:hypothetical protein n=1 Tax=Mycolicibacterium TaxID=1866885 RepID=UPI000A753909|nr:MULTISPECIES: hypothetical protein [Mycolicibacterium]WGI35793.1 hypothetical protein QDT91_28045 [Mycolicibacterium aubagnense]
MADDVRGEVTRVGANLRAGTHYIVVPDGMLKPKGFDREVALHRAKDAKLVATQGKRRRHRQIRGWKRAAPVREPSPPIVVEGIRYAQPDWVANIPGTPKLLVAAPGHDVTTEAPANVREYADQLLAIIEVKLKAQLSTINAADIDLAVLGPVDAVAENMLSQLPASHPFDKTIGPFYDLTGAANRMHVSEDTARARAAAHEVLACPTAEGDMVFPTFQFNSDGAVVAGLDRVLTALAAGTADHWQVALWLTTPNEQLKGRTPVAALREGASVVQAVAEQTAERWCH